MVERSERFKKFEKKVDNKGVGLDETLGKPVRLQRRDTARTDNVRVGIIMLPNPTRILPMLARLSAGRRVMRKVVVTERV